jgi:hypothetical protein
MAENLAYALTQVLHNFGAASYYHYGRLPEIHGVALAALAIKMTCAVAGPALAVIPRSRGERSNGARRRASWVALAVPAATALAAAAFLRWFS